ncbi:hypothetical protein SPRG_06563 [Saprolegnia parasitica CBS 223.65]|uniref:Uncharacterized protein n=1 Tax=Saprolegnia parasitica (strain CBS 223.65) TaxID=695850 RepID=A0A067CE20_SAPPC|nr:hypothetical protein SPRG_06563 [Saprolegnia parasitica CBS 223.65]KDO28708.1 hypothetical protein SPRG_06563 [Saprolegnia parasitica CBS 223.65]|eukprot:XP_012200764.1 hypothetical protein SPRG_06563 [Saprolegnia parasitica CBS 223.65]
MDLDASDIVDARDSFDEASDTWDSSDESEDIEPEEAYNDALVYIKHFSHVYHNSVTSCRYDDWLQLRVDGVDGLLSWPLPEHRVRQLAALAGDTNAIPADKLYIRNDASWSTYLLQNFLDVVQRNVLDPAPQGQKMRVLLSHLVVDSVGSAAALQATGSGNSFGSLLIELPSPYEGGDLTYPHRSGPECLKAVARNATRITTTLFGTELSSAPITSGTRIALVYSLVADGPVTRPTQDAVITELTLLAETSPLEYVAYMQAETEDDELSFAALNSTDTTRVEVLLATSAFDIALVTFHKPRTMAEADEVDGDPYVNSVERFLLHPACRMPADVANGLYGLSEDAFLTRVLPLLQAAVDDPTTADLIGFSTARDLAVHIIPLFMMNRREFHSVLPKATSAAGYATTFGRLLLQINDMDLVTRFLGDAIIVTDVTAINDAASCVQACLLQCGWPELQETFTGLLARWYVPDAMLLLSSLAGIALDPVCPALAQPFVCEFLKPGWHSVRPRAMRYRPLDTAGFMADCILLDWYVDEHAPNLPRGNWLSAHLPPAMVGAVDAFFYPRRPGASTLLASTELCSAQDLLVHLPSVLARVRRSQPSVQLQVYVDAVVAAVDSISGRVTLLHRNARPDAFATLLHLLDTNGLVTATRLESLWRLWGFAALAGTSHLFLVLNAAPSPQLRSLLSPKIMDAVTTLEEKSFDFAVDNPHHESFGRPSVAALEALAVVSPASISTFAAAWAAQLPPHDAEERDVALARYRYFLFLFLQTLYDVAPHEKALVTCLATQFLALLGDVRDATPLPAMTDYVIRDIAVDPTHCADRKIFREFLNDGAMRRRVGHIAALCDVVRGTLHAHPTRLRAIKCEGSESDDEDSIEKEEQPGCLAEDIRMVAAVDAILANVRGKRRDKSAISDERRPKLQRCSDDHHDG